LIDPTLRVARKKPNTLNAQGALEIYPSDFLNSPDASRALRPERPDSVLEEPVQLDGAVATPRLDPSHQDPGSNLEVEQTEKEKPEVVIKLGFEQLQRDWIYLISEVPREEVEGGGERKGG
jgi:hypothetical protein